MDFTHFDTEGNAQMVDVGHKTPTHRRAVAEGFITVSDVIFEAVKAHTIKKGDVLSVAQLAGIMGAKETSRLIPLCHPLALTKVKVLMSLDEEKKAIKAEATVEVTGVTGVEMEALTAVQVALLTVYDMCKALGKDMVIGPVYLVEKEGGKSGYVKNDYKG